MNTVHDWCRHRYWKFLLVSCIGPLFMNLYNINIQYFMPTKNIIIFLKYFDYIFIPRSLLEIGMIETISGNYYYQLVVVFDFLTSILCISLILWHIKYLQKSKIKLLKMDKKNFYTALLVATLIIFRPTTISHTSFSENLIDQSGFYFFREGLLMCSGYYFTMKIIVNKISTQ